MIRGFEPRRSPKLSAKIQIVLVWFKKKIALSFEYKRKYLFLAVKKITKSKGESSLL